MGKTCHICGQKAVRNDQISLHRFPKNPVVRNEWIKACGLMSSKDLSRTYICSMHFDDKDVDKGYKFQTRCSLKTSAIPTIGVPNQNGFKIENILNDEDGNVNVISNTPNNDHAFSLESENTHNEQLQSSSILPDKASPQQRCTTPENGEVNENIENGCSTPKRRYYEPRFVSEIRPSDFATPKKTQRVLNLVQETDKRKTKLVKSLQDQNRKLKKQVSSLKLIVANLKKQIKSFNGTQNNRPNAVNKYDHSYAIIEK